MTPMINSLSRQLSAEKSNQHALQREQKPTSKLIDVQSTVSWPQRLQRRQTRGWPVFNFELARKRLSMSGVRGSNLILTLAMIHCKVVSQKEQDFSQKVQDANRLEEVEVCVESVESEDVKGVEEVAALPLVVGTGDVIRE
ncbi:hypothetical protein H6P81_019364 [Aristolochia fimbriata]|uniref:Uncharacterized protein n=1 Tax=Aristolochia fimbriata TaxID=158543 RepID=A0AAV7DSD4_ARIFI|nr:hypothetical protein H6P81_019364 [Aristolochia fimbriata]